MYSLSRNAAISSLFATAALAQCNEALQNTSFDLATNPDPSPAQHVFSAGTPPSAITPGPKWFNLRKRLSPSDPSFIGWFSTAGMSGCEFPLHLSQPALKQHPDVDYYCISPAQWITMDNLGGCCNGCNFLPSACDGSTLFGPGLASGTFTAVWYFTPSLPSQLPHTDA
jgi:hypothetical protein